MRPISLVSWRWNLKPSRRSSMSLSRGPKITSSSVRAEWTNTRSSTSSSWSSARSMLMIGVTPLPALMKSIFSGRGFGSVKSPSTPPRRRIVPGLSSRVRWGETTPSSTSFGVTQM
jgi:hypothetical protein